MGLKQLRRTYCHLQMGAIAKSANKVEELSQHCMSGMHSETGFGGAMGLLESARKVPETWGPKFGLQRFHPFWRDSGHIWQEHIYSSSSSNDSEVPKLHCHLYTVDLNLTSVPTRLRQTAYLEWLCSSGQWRHLKVCAPVVGTSNWMVSGNYLCLAIANHEDCQFKFR